MDWLSCYPIRLITSKLPWAAVAIFKLKVILERYLASNDIEVASGSEDRCWSGQSFVLDQC